MKKIKWLMICLCALLLGGCGGSEEQTPGEYYVYYVDKNENSVMYEEISFQSDDTKVILQRLFQELQTPPEDASYRSAIPEGVELEAYSYGEGQLVLNFGTSYGDLSPTGEVLSRAAIVRTLCQVEGVDYVAFNVAGQPLVNRSGALVGYMTADQFVDNAGNEINAYEKANLTWYYADESGTKLVAHTVEQVYNSNISIDKLVVEALIAGPEGGDSTEGGYGTISSSTQIVSVTTRDGVCYVNLSKGFLEKKENISPEVTIYSIVNSLVELPAVNKVQISVDGNSNIMYMEKVSLSQALERNLEIMENAQ